MKIRPLSRSCQVAFNLHNPPQPSLPGAAGIASNYGHKWAILYQLLFKLEKSRTNGGVHGELEIAESRSLVIRSLAAKNRRAALTIGLRHGWAIVLACGAGCHSASGVSFRIAGHFAASTADGATSRLSGRRPSAPGFPGPFDGSGGNSSS